MDTTLLRAFVSKARASNRLLYGDLRRLQCDVLPSGARTREEVELLLTLDPIERLDEDWPGYLARTVTAFVLSASDQLSAVDAEAAAWLTTALADMRAKTAATVTRAVVSEAHQVDDALLAFVRRGAKRSAMASVA